MEQKHGTIIKNIEFSNINISIEANGTASSTNGGVHVGIVTGKMYHSSKIANVIVKNSTITDANTIRLSTSSFQIFVGGIAGLATNTTASETDPGDGKRYSIENCFSDVDIDLDVTSSSWLNPRANVGQFAIGGVIGAIRSQAVWPSNCLYTGTLNATYAFIGPIFGYVRSNTSYTSTGNYPSLWYGDDAGRLEMTSYYSTYTTNNSTFTSTYTNGNTPNNTTYRRSTSTSSMNNVQGMNKGIYISDISSMLDIFNSSTIDTKEYTSWSYANGTYSLIPRLEASIDNSNAPTYKVNIVNNYNQSPTYTYKWYINNELDTSNTSNSITQEPSLTNEYNFEVIISDGTYYGIAKFTIPALDLHIEFDINKNNNSVVARLAGEALPYINLQDYTYQWYKEDITGISEKLEGETNLTLSNLEEGYDYKLIAINARFEELTREASFTYGDRTVIYVNYSDGSDSNNGLTPETPVRNLSSAYGKLNSNGTRNTNVIVIMGTYSSTAFMNSETATTYAKPATITGKYKDKDYNGTLYFYGGTSSYRYLTADTAFQYLTFYGGNNQMYFYLQGHSLTIGEDVVMSNYASANENQGLLGSRAPAFHIICGWLQYNYAKLPRNNPEIIIKSGTYGRIILGGSPGTNSASNLYQTTSHNFMGSSMDDCFNISVTIDIKKSTTSALTYDHDVNLLVGGSACGNNYSKVTENIISGRVGRVLGGSIGDSSNTGTDINRNWNYPTNTFLGETTINIAGGEIAELYGGCLGRNMTAIDSYNGTGNTCDSYFYGTINVNMTGGKVKGNIYGAGAGGVTGYSSTSSDPYKSYGQSFNTSVNLNILGGSVTGNIYGGGYGYTEYLTENVTATDAGALYGNSNIVIGGGAIINGNIYGAGRGYNLSSKQQIAQTHGQTEITITGNPTINGEIFGAGEGISGYTNMAKLIGTSTINLSSDLNSIVYGGGNIAQAEGTTYVNINSGTQTQDIYGGGNIGEINGATNVNITGGIGKRVFGGGNKADVTTSNVMVNGGITNEIYAGGNEASCTNTNLYLKGGNVTTSYGGSNQSGAIQNTTVKITGGTHETIYGGNNIGGTTNKTNIKINGGKVGTAIYGGGNQVNAVESNIELLNSEEAIPNIYGGGNQANVDSTYINCTGGAVTNIFGGSNIIGTVNNSNITIDTGSIDNIYGGNNLGGATESTNINVNSGNIGNIFGGGNEAVSSISNITVNSGNISNIYGGGNKAGIITSNIETFGGNIVNLFGGSNVSGDVSTSNITTNNSNKVSTSDLKMTVTKSVSKTESWQSTTYPTIATIKIVLKNNSSYSINKWEANILSSNSIMSSNYSNSEIIEENGKYTFNEKNRYYGTNTIPANGSYTIEFTILSMQSQEDFTLGYGAIATNSNGETLSDSSLGIQNLYGGNNQGGKTSNTYLNINGGNPVNIYGGGNQAVTDSTNVQINGNVLGNVYGGGNQAAVNTSTNVITSNGSIENNIYGGGNEGIVWENTNITISNSTIKGSAYAGGNGATAIVRGNTNINIEGTSIIGTEDSIPPHSGSVFGGGNAAATGTLDDNNSKSTVNIAGGTMYGNVYGGANTSVVYGIANVNIGLEALTNKNLSKSDIYIKGTIFGGGEANASGSENYDYSFISVTEGIVMNIDATGYNSFKTTGSVFGSGNASSTSGESYINIKNYGTIDNPQSNISIQRATTVTLDNSSIKLSGAKDRTNEYSNVFFSLSRVNELKLKNNSNLYLQYGSNLLTKLSSVVDENGEEQKARVSINNETGELTKNVDNRIYMYEGKNLNIATNEQVTAYGEVYGMTFLGIFTNTVNPATSTGLYNHNYKNGDYISNPGTFSSNSYVLAMHKPDHDTTIDGFYSNYDKNGYVECKYIETTPEDDLYYIWLVGEEMDVTSFEVTLTASKYATLGTYELPLTGFGTPNTKLTISGFSSGLTEGVSLVEPAKIDAIADNSELSDKMFGLGLKSGRRGWQTNSSTNFYTESGGTYQGSSDYNKDNSSYTPTLIFCFYHSQNLSLEQQLGTVKIRFQVATPIDDLNYQISYLDINVTLTTALYQDNYYEAAITPGEEFDLFTTTETDITDKSIFSTYYSLLINEFSKSDYYLDYGNYEHILVSRDSSNRGYALPQNTKLTMLDMANNKYYYYVVTSDDETSGKYTYNLSDFVEMGSTNKRYNKEESNLLYYNKEQDLIYENFIFHVDFSGTNIQSDILNNTLLMELQDSEKQTLIGVLGIQRDTTKYNVYTNKNSTIDVSATISEDTIYLGNKFNINVTTDFTQPVIQSKSIYDTEYFNKKMGIKITFYDSNGNQLNIDSLLGLTFSIDGKVYYPRIDGTTRINIAERVSNVLSRIEVNTNNNNTLNTGTYTVKIETFGSSDGIYYGLESSDYTELQFSIINSSYGLKVATDDKSKTIDKDTGKTLNGNNSLVTFVNYSSAFKKPIITMSLYRRDYSTMYSNTYKKVNLQDYVTNNLTQKFNENEYFVVENPASSNTFFLMLKENLPTGTYKLVYKLYDDSKYIGEAYEYLVIQ